jgi:tellurite resistance protein
MIVGTWNLRVAFAIGRREENMRSYPCLIVGMPEEGRAAYVKDHVREGDEITLARVAGDPRHPNAVACFHGRRCIGYIPTARPWVGHSLAQGDRHQAKVTGFDTTDGGELSSVEIEITILGEAGARPDEPARRSIISEAGDELRILAMVAAADRRFAESERALLERFADMRAHELGLDIDAGEAAHAVRWARRKPADSLEAARIIDRLTTERPEALPVILDASELMAEIDGSLDQEERAILATLRNLLLHGLKIAKDRSG